MNRLHMGINMGHDRSVAVVQGGEVLVAIEQERLDRIKHSVGFMLQAPQAIDHIQVPGESIAYCLDHLGVSLSDMASITANMPGVDMAPQIMRGKFSADLASQVRTIPSHHLAHAYSAFWPSGFEDALVLVVDASGSTVSTPDGRRTESYTLYEGHGTELRELHSETVRSHLATLSTLGFVYEAVSRRAGFVTNLNSGLSFPEAGKLMGLAAYGGPQENWHRWLSVPPGSHEVQISAYDIFLEIAALEKRFDSGDGKPYMRPWLVDLAYKIQTELEEVLCALVSHACKETGLRRVCVAGGVGLNSVANYKILRECGLDEIFIFPAAADNGIAAGCALWGYHKEDGGSHRPALGSACLGRPYTSSEIEDAIAPHTDLLTVELQTEPEMVQRVAGALAQGHIVARFEGGSEFGPRSLGHRSILADPSFERMKDVVNARVKFREAFRPFAPVVPLDKADVVFELDQPSPYMLLVAPVREEFRDKLPAITHEDGTGRIQTCTPEQDPFFHALCLQVEQVRGGMPVLMNTSFNVAGQPIVETPSEAIETFLRTDIDFLAMEGYWIRRRHQPVRDYSEHVRGLPLEPRPRGLDPAQPGVQDLMQELDAAIFHGSPSQHWSEAEVASLSAQGARFRETSRLFSDTPLLSPISGQLAADATLILDPIGHSLLIDESSRQSPEQLDQDRLQIVMALRLDPGPVKEELRLALGATPAELDDLVQEMATVLDRFGIPVHQDWRAEHPEPDNAAGFTDTDLTLSDFQDEGFDARPWLRRIRRSILDHGYSESAVCEMLGVECSQALEPTWLHYHDAYTLPESPLGDLIRLFSLRASVPRPRVEEIFSANDIEDLSRLGILATDAETVSAKVSMFCSGGLLLVTDHRFMIQPTDGMDEDPVMYIGMDSHGLVQAAPRSRCSRVLDLCCGSGIQGLVATRYAHEVVAVDLNPRAVRFARFNAQLNGIHNYQALQGDLYQAVSDQTFDCILANPPFVPSPEESLGFRDGGPTGENILRSIVEQAWPHLTPGGRLCIVSDLVDIQSYESKLRGWTREEATYGLLLTTADRDEILFSVPHCHAPFSQSYAEYVSNLDRWVENFRRSRMSAVNFGFILLWRREEGAGCDITQRTIHSPTQPIWLQVEDWLDQRRRWDSPDAASMTVSLHPDLRIVTDESPCGDNKACELRVPENPFFTVYPISPAIADELRAIQTNQPNLARISNSREVTPIESLHRLGILRLGSTQKNPNGTTAPQAEGTLDTIVQRATKTTPTCLSNYLH